MVDCAVDGPREYACGNLAVLIISEVSPESTGDIGTANTNCDAVYEQRQPGLGGRTVRPCFEDAILGTDVIVADHCRIDRFWVAVEAAACKLAERCGLHRTFGGPRYREYFVLTDCVAHDLTVNSSGGGC